MSAAGPAAGAGERTRLSLPGVDWLALEIDGHDGTLTLGETTIGVQVASGNGSPATVDVDPGEVTLGTLSAAAHSAGGADPLAALPDSLAAFLAGTSIAHVHVAGDLEKRSLTALAVEVDSEAPWVLVPDRLEVDDLHLSFVFTREDGDARVEVKGMAKVLGSDVDLGVSGPKAGAWTVSLSAADVPLFSLASLDRVAGTQLAGVVPEGLGDLGGVAVEKLELTLGGDGGGLGAIAFDVRPTAPWNLVPDHLAVHDVEVALEIDHPADSAERAVTGTIAGTLTLESVDVPIEASRPKADDPWTVTLAGGDGIALGSLGEAAALAGGEDLAGHLPPGVSDLPGLTLSDVAIVAPAGGGVDSIGAKLATSAALDLPEPIGISIERLSLTLSVEHPTRAAERSVALSAEGVATFAGAEVSVSLEREAGEEAHWTLSAGLEPGSTLSASTIASSYGAALPPQMPDLALSEFRLTAVLGGGELEITAASSTDWTVPVGPDGIGVGDLTVALKHHAPDAQGRSFEGSIGGTVHLAGVEIPLSYTVPGGLKLTATVKELAPFALLQDACGPAVIRDLMLPPEVLALALEDVEIEIDVERSELSFAASGPGFKRVQAIVRKSTTWGFAVGIELDDDYKFSSLSPDLAGLDSVHLPDALIVVSSFDDPAFAFDELQPVAGKGVTRGLTIDGRLDLSGLGADKLLGESHLDVKAHVGTKLSDLALDAGIGDVHIADGVVLQDAEFELTPDPENVSISVFGAVDVDIDKSALEFIGAVKVEPNGISFSATMKGTWNEPFGTKGVAVSNLALEIGADFEGVPSIGLTGGLRVGDFTGMAAVAFNSEIPTQSVLVVAFDHLALIDVVRTFCPPDVAAGIPADVSTTLAGIGLEDVDLYVVPQNTTIGRIKYDQGLRVGGTLHVAGLSATSNVEIDPQSGVAASGSLSPLHLGDVFSLTGAGTDPGPNLDLELKATDVPKIVVSGSVALLGVTASADLSFSDDGFRFDVRGRVFGAFDARIDVSGGSILSAEGFTVHAEMHQDFLSDAAQRAAAVLQQAGNEAAARIASAEQAVESARAEVARANGAVDAARGDLAARRADAQTQIAAAQAAVTQAQGALAGINTQIASTRATIQAERDASAARIRDAQAAVAGAQAPVTSLDGQIASTKAQIDQLNRDIAWWHSWYDNLAWWDKAWGWTRLGAEVGWRGTQVSALWVAVGTLEGSKRTAQAGLQVAQQTLQASQAAAATYPIEQDPRMLALATELGSAQVAFQAAQGTLTAAQQATAAGIAAADQTLQAAFAAVGAATATLQATTSTLDGLRQGLADAAAVAGYIAQHGLGALLDVRSASFTGSLSATSGGAVTLDADVRFLDQDHTVHVAYDFNDLAAGARALAHELVPSLPA